MVLQRFLNGENSTARELAERFAQIALRTDDPDDRRIADRLLGSADHYGGDQQRAQGHFESMLDQYTAPSDHRRLNLLHYDSRVLPEARLARVLWMRGAAKEAIQVAQASV